ncbi:DNA mismatch endonuclease Vsr [Parasphingorhabdus flavimaris]|uniref:Very short patch repair endonuclease n=1 Tax=Parasphingorhabdus flavimaris TaxID=266812 RepID=A0ABX2MZ94_9SPHN|nr:very short patch repair endonuclease [Parasphingorhabdus flavimaris]NVD26777.1 DNA mismatch endonuclease Vsr [Parasphingorhabdus flavimaris]
MSDIVDQHTRSRMMSAIKGANTKPELLLRSALHRKGFRFRVNYRKLPGKPDLVLPRYNAVIFVNGCFWHRHGCHLFQWPRTRENFWREKIMTNVARDIRNQKELIEKDWRIAVVWECAFKGKTRKPLDQTIARCAKWLKGTTQRLDISGNE